MAEHRVEDDSAAVVGVADDLVAGNEREADEMFEVARRMAVDRRQVRTADTGEPGIRTQSGVGSSGASSSISERGPTAAPAPGRSRDAAIAAA